jgi:hypothetical protein
MNARYRSVRICNLDMVMFRFIIRLQYVSFRCCLRLLTIELGRDYHVAKRVRDLYIQRLGVACKPQVGVFQSFNEPYTRAMQTFFDSAKERVPSSATIDFDWSHPTRELDRYFTRALNQMSCVTRCTWAFTEGMAVPPSIHLPSAFSADWPSFSPNLENLRLIRPITKAARGLESAHFPVCSVCP